MKLAKEEIKSRKQSIPAIQFGDQQLTSFSGIVVFQSFFEAIDLEKKLKAVCSTLSRKNNRQYCHSKILHCLIIHLLIGFSKLRDLEYYKDDPLLKRTLKLKTLPSVPTVCRMLSDFDPDTIKDLHNLNSELVVTRLRESKLRIVTLDIDGTILSTSRHCEGSAVGFNKKKKGLRSYYPLFAMIAQTSQILKFHYRPGNVHDSNGAVEFIEACIRLIRKALPKAIIELRMDSAFFSEEIIDRLNHLKVEYSITVPFERFTELKTMIENCSKWHHIKNGKGHSICYFESRWKPLRWENRGRFLFVKTPTKKQVKGPLQLDLFEPVDYENKYKVILTNKTKRAGTVVCFHEGRGMQEKLFGEAKTQTGLDYIPCRKRCANEVYLLCSVIVHNCNRELQMRAGKPGRRTTRQRKPLWIFEEMKTIRHKIIQTAGKLSRPQNKWTLHLPKSAVLEREFRRLMPEVVDVL